MKEMGMMESAPPIDLVYLEDITGGDKDFLRELFTTFEGEVSKNLPRIERAMTPFQGQEVYAAAHAFVGTANCIGAHRLLELARHLEGHAQAGRRDQTEQALDIFRTEVRRVMQFLTEYLG